MSAILRWSSPVLEMRAGDATWRPYVELHNPSDQEVEVAGSQMARGVLIAPDGQRVLSQQEQPWPVAAVLRVIRLASGSRMSCLWPCPCCRTRWLRWSRVSID